ncbi:MAG: restriction endonuclease subunit S [Deltaproteobacteria bacterium]|nr:restriction endonuclease subunit S [Candidatus Tharpellaceae bacterium]
MVSFQESKVEWLGKIPNHWSITKLKNQCQIIPSNVDKKSHEDETEVKLCNYVDVYYNELIDDSIEYMVATANEHELKKFQLLEGDVLITKDSEDPHDIAVPALVVKTQPKLLCGYHLSIIRSDNRNFNGSYLFWVLRDASIASQLHREATGITRWAIANRHVKNSIIPLPSETEQKAIASYLDKTCAAIDKTIEAKQKQLEILDDLRKSIIHKAVTRGLDDSVELKDSEVEWLGRISKHWFITKLKNQCQIIPSNVDKKSHDDETEVRLCNYVDVYYNEFIDNSIEYMVATANEHELKKFQLLEGDVLVTKDSEDPYDIAVPALVVETRPKFLCGYHLSIIRSNNQKFNGSYLFWALKDVSIASQLHREATGITRWAIANKHIKNSLIPLPPDAEQKLIASYLIT